MEKVSTIHNTSKNDGAIRLTVSKYYLPSGGSISEVGVNPDIFIAESSDEFRIDTDTDNQLEFALNYLMDKKFSDLPLGMVLG